MNKLFSICCISILSIGLFSCGSNHDSVETANKVNESRIDDHHMNIHEDDAAFLVKATESNMLEIELGHLALRIASHQDVKNYAQMMVDDHTKANEKVKELALAKNVTLPSALGSEDQKHYDEMSKMTGKEFEKHYINMMVDGHEEVLKAYRTEADKTSDAELRAFASEMLPTIMKHQEDAKRIKEKL